MLESEYQRDLIKKIKAALPGCYILKNDPTHLQGIPDLLVLYEDRWAMLEVKISKAANTQSNQAYYVNEFSKMGYASFVYPECEEKTMNELKSWLKRK